MIAIDTNILVDILVRSQPDHARASAWLQRCKERLAMTHVNVAEILRLLTHPRVFASHMALRPAIDLLNHFIDDFDVAVLEESPVWWRDLQDSIKHVPRLRGNEVFDARIALCLRHNGVRELCTKDADFTKYPFIRIIPI